MYICSEEIIIYYVNTSEFIAIELLHKNFISSHMKITCYLHTWRDHRCYDYKINRAFFTGVPGLLNQQNITCPRVDMNFIFLCSTQYLTCLLRSLTRYRVEHLKIKFKSTCGHVIFFYITMTFFQNFRVTQDISLNHVTDNLPLITVVDVSVSVLWTPARICWLTVWFSLSVKLQCHCWKLQ